ncbi:MAG: glycosyltransferase [Verrucomicrobia bacterium]|nr:glycosyltransferase [Verrucomicrobiota bacterium]MDA1088296.1 glycosyltransferase [Verrucomicrobiota bacterium]
MKILAVAEHLDLAETHTLLGMHAAGVDLSVMLHPAVPHFSTLHDQLPDVTPLEMRRDIDPEAIRSIRRKLRSRPYDVLYMIPTKRPVIQGLRASRGMSIKRVAYRGVVGSISQLNVLSHLSYLSPNLDRIFCACDAVRDGLHGVGIARRKLVRIYKGHDLDWYHPAPRSTLAPLGMKRDDFVVACATHIQPRKGVPILLKALDRLVQNSELPIHVLLLGEVADRAVRRLGRDPRISHRVHFAGNHPDTTALVAACDAFVMPSLRREGMARSVMEAMAQGLPTVVSDVGGLPELVRHGESGLVARAGDPIALAAAIEQLARDPELCRLLGAGARARIRADFTIQDTVRETIAAFGALAPSGEALPGLTPRPVHV